MIERKYTTPIDCDRPKNYFEKWYASMWRRRFPGVNSIYPEECYPVITEELALIGAVDMSQPNGTYYELVFKNDEDYTMFVLRWE